MCDHAGSLTTLVAVYTPLDDKWVCTAAICNWCNNRRVIWPDTIKMNSAYGKCKVGQVYPRWYKE